jgi:hypothetical protein
MKRILPLFAVFLAASACLAEPVSLMPRSGDFTHMWWAEGFPGRVEGAPWLRCIRTGSYAFVLDTEKLAVPHFGPVAGGPGYVKAAREDNSAWRKLPVADLSLSISVAGKIYRCTGGAAWTEHGGPRLIESGRFLQRADVTGLAFAADDGAKLNADARFETVAWPDRLALVLSARPGLVAIPAGDACFGRLGGGFGFDGTNHFEEPHRAELEQEQFTLELWAYVPADYAKATKAFPWLVCKNANEEANGNYGFMLLHGEAMARLNIGGGKAGSFAVQADRSTMKPEAWNHLAMSYDGDTLRMFVNGKAAGSKKIGLKRVSGNGGMAFGRRQDNSGDGYHFRGAVDEVRLYHRALTPEELLERFTKPEAVGPKMQSVAGWSFRKDGSASTKRPNEDWPDAIMEIRFSTPRGVLTRNAAIARGSTEDHEVALALDPVSFTESPASDGLVVQASEIPGGASRSVEYDSKRGWHRVNLDGIEPVVIGSEKEDRNNSIERVKLTLANPTQREQSARLLFEKTANGIRQAIGSPITGISAMLRNADGQPTGIPVQLSKNWHNRVTDVAYWGQWFHGFSQVRLAPGAKVELELTISYGHWGGVAAASHAQLCLVGWGSNQLWNQSALGAWGESICYEPDQAQAQCLITDVRPMMVDSVSGNQPWGWTHNVGGGDFFRLFDAAGHRVPPVRMRTACVKQGPCLTGVTYAGRTGDGLEHASTVSLARTDDIVRGIYHLRLDVARPVDFSRFVIFQIGADTYSYTGERKMAFGNETGLVKEWATRWGGDINRTQPIECTGRVPWISLHEGGGEPFQFRSSDATPGLVKKQEKPVGAWANRGIVIRSWKARLGGKAAAPWIAEHGVKARGGDTSTLDILPPPDVKQLLPGDFVEATIEHLILPQSAEDYYGPNAALRGALATDGNTWRMVRREAVGNDRRVEMKSGELTAIHPAITIRAKETAAEFTLAGGLGYVPVTITGLASPGGPVLTVDGRPVNQSIHGNDFWQTDYDADTRRWSHTFNIPVTDAKPHSIHFTTKP